MTYLATGVASDAEMRHRIEAHRRARPVDWAVVEEPLALGDALPGTAGGTVVLDSVDTWLANRMEAAGGAQADLGGGRGEGLVDACIAELAKLEGAAGHLVAVSAEVGLSLLPLNAYGRAFADLLGLLNQRLAARAGEVYLVVAGLPVPLKPSAGRDASGMS